MAGRKGPRFLLAPLEALLRLSATLLKDRIPAVPEPLRERTYITYP